jgi:hypothetical protein
MLLGDPVEGPPRSGRRRHWTEQARLVPQRRQIRDRAGPVRDGYGQIDEDLTGHVTRRERLVGVEKDLVPPLDQARRPSHLPEQLRAGMRHNPRPVCGHIHADSSLATLHVPSAFLCGTSWTSKTHSFPYGTGTLVHPGVNSTRHPVQQRG